MIPVVNIYDYQDLDQLEQVILSSKDEYVAIDTETSGLRWAHGDRAFGISIAWDDQSVYLRNTEVSLEKIKILLKAIYSSNKTVLFHNMKFDSHMIRETYGVEELPNKYIDTLLVAYLLDTGSSHALKNWGEREWGNAVTYHEDLLKEYRNRYKIKDYRFLPAEILDPYAANDAVLTKALAMKYVPMVKEDSPRWFDIEHQLIPVIMKMERVGIKIDLEYIAKKRKEYKLRIYNIEKQIYQKVGKKLNVASPKQVSDFLYTRCKVQFDPGDLIKSEDSEDRTLTVISQKEKKYPLAAQVSKLIQEYRSLSKLDSTYFAAYENVHVKGRLYPSWNQSGTKTSRFCVSPDTYIEMPRDLLKYPKGIPLREIKSGDLVYSFDWEKRLSLKKVKWVGPTKTKKTLIITFRDEFNGNIDSIKVSHDHLVRMYRGEWKPAGTLQVGNRMLCMVHRGFSKGGYSSFFPSSKNRSKKNKKSTTGGIIQEHRWIYAQLVGKDRLHGGWDIHHKDHNKLNNSTDNLECLSKSAHIKKHNIRTSREEVEEMLKSGIYTRHPKTIRRLIKYYGISFEGKLKHSNYLKGTNHTIIDIKEGSEEQLWDLEIEDTHTFIGNGVALHNSSSDPNATNIPRNPEVRRCILPDKHLVAIDMNQVEHRLFCFAARDMEFIAGYLRGDDPHKMTASSVFGKPLTAISSEERRIAKAVNFLCLFGGGAEKFSMTAGISVNEASRILSTLWLEHPNLKRFSRETTKFAEKYGYIHTLFGRKISVDPQFAYVSPNYMIQGSNGDILKINMVRCAKLAQELDFHISNVVHDEIVFDGLEFQHVPKVIKQMEAFNLSDEEQGLYMPITAGVKHSFTNWGEMEEEWTENEKYSGVKETKGLKILW
jgi:DNA polymerase I-like protein with 3'-5' exonuclease and polymerase domains